MKRTGRHATRRTSAPRPSATQHASHPKVVEIVRLVEALSDSLGSHDGVLIGRGIARLLVDAYGERPQPMPRWVRELVAHYAPAKRKS